MTSAVPFTRWWTRGDHDNLLAGLARYRPTRVLEFGPGRSTLAFVEAGAARVDTYEDDPDWAQVYRDRLAPWPVIRLHEYPPGTVPTIEGPYDVAFVDGPKHSGTRLPYLELARQVASVVLFHDADTIHKVYPDVRYERLGTATGTADLGRLL